jgi:hypothetical protein
LNRTCKKFGEIFVIPLKYCLLILSTSMSRQNLNFKKIQNQNCVLSGTITAWMEPILLNCNLNCIRFLLRKAWSLLIFGPLPLVLYVDNIFTVLVIWLGKQSPRSCPALASYTDSKTWKMSVYFHADFRGKKQPFFDIFNSQ